MSLKNTLIGLDGSRCSFKTSYRTTARISTSRMSLGPKKLALFLVVFEAFASYGLECELAFVEVAKNCVH